MAARNVSPLSRSAAARPLPDLRALADFEPTATQRHFVQLAVAGEASLRISAVCQRLGIARSTYYRWLEDPGFRGWMALQWSMALLTDGGRLLSIARVRAESDYRYFKTLMELIFDPRGLGLIATWQQRMAGGSTETEESAPAVAEETAPLFPAGDSFLDEEDAEEDTMENDAPAAEDDGEADEAPANEEAPGESAPVASSSSSASTESTTCAAATQHFPPAARPPEPAPKPADAPPPPYVPHYAPPWPTGGGRFHH